LETDLFNSGIRPAINAGLSVSRVGGAAQTKLIKKFAGGVRLALAQYRELAAFSQFLSDLDEATRKQLERGQRITEIMKQKQYMPMSVGNMGLILFAADQGYLDDVPLNRIAMFEQELNAYVHANHREFIEELGKTGDLNDEIKQKLTDIMVSFKKNQSWD
jgi:F-type H+-transporting ATPase subunit alpha